ncbi:MAG: flavodoxin family protein [Sphaerochaetaceae bacterium]|nr:flavodoxin family protein [Sphaerochaetaceae bacterium]
MDRCSIIVHSVNGNNYLIASHMQEIMKEKGVDARLYRVEDEDLHIWANKSDAANDYYEDIQALPVVNESVLEKSQMIILGSPTTFGNVSAEMKAFMDSTEPLLEDNILEGKFFACFTSCTYSICEGAFCIDSMVHFAQTHKMIHLPLGIHEDLSWANQPVSGIVHLAGKDNAIRPSTQLGDVIQVYCEMLSEYMVDDEE